MKLANQRFESFHRNQYTLGVFIDLSKVFDTVNHSVLISKLQIYDIRGINLAWFSSYVANRKKYVSMTLKQTLRHILLHASILLPLLLLLDVKDFPNFSVRDPIMFADDTNQYLEHTDFIIFHCQ